jgi:hypothetical protein
MDDEAEWFMFEIEHDAWATVTEPLPESLYDLDALTRLRPIVYVVIHPFYLELRRLSGANQAAGRDRPAHYLDRAPIIPRLDPCPFLRQGDRGRAAPATGGGLNRVAPGFWG